MCVHKSAVIYSVAIVVSLFGLSIVSLFADNTVDSLRYRIHLQAHVGRSASIIERSTSVDKAEYTRNGIDWSIRAVAQPDHLLGLGLELGSLHFSKLLVKNDATLPDGSTMSLSALPILGVFSMEKYGVELSGGVGTFLYQAELVAPGGTTTGQDWEIGWCGGLAYRFEISHHWLLGLEGRYYTIPERSVGLFSGGLRIQYQIWY